VNDRPANVLTVLHVFRYFRPDFTGEGLYLEKLARHLAKLQIRTDVAVECTYRPAASAPIDDIRRIR
jgi:hypothetical protein